MMASRLGAIALCLFLFAGCVSNIDRAGQKVDRQQALEAHLRLGLSYLQKRDRDRALRAFSEAQKLDPNSAEASQGIAMVHQINGENDQADKMFKKALRSKPAFSMANIELSYAQFLYENDRCSEAEKLLAKARTDISYPSRSKALYMLGLCAVKTENAVLARGAFEHALNLEKGHSGAALEMADIAFSEREYSEAKRYLDIYSDNVRQRNARSLWLGIRIERIFGNKDREASYAIALKNLHPYSKEYLEYKKFVQ